MWLSMNTEEAKLSNVEYPHIRQIMYDMKNGVLAFDKNGKILFANPQMVKFFENVHLVDETVHSLMYEYENPENDAFWDVIFDVLHNRATHFQKKVRFVSPTGRVYSFHMTTSYIQSDPECVVISVSDETEYDLAVKKKHDSTMILIGMQLVVCLTVFVTELHVFVEGAFPHDWIARCTEAAGFLFILFCLKYTSLTVKDFGIIPTNPKKELIEGLIVSGGMVVLMCIAKLVMMLLDSSLFPDGQPFFDFTAPPPNYYLKYITIVLGQEVITKCGLQKSLSKIIEGRHKTVISIAFASIMFMAVHVQHGLIYMIGAGILSAFLAVLYERHNSLLCCSIVHYVFGITGLVLQWVR